LSRLNRNGPGGGLEKVYVSVVAELGDVNVPFLVILSLEVEHGVSLMQSPIKPKPVAYAFKIPGLLGA
jgi:hypothetical protein